MAVRALEEVEGALIVESCTRVEDAFVGSEDTGDDTVEVSTPEEVPSAPIKPKELPSSPSTYRSIRVTIM